MRSKKAHPGGEVKGSVAPRIQRIHRDLLSQSRAELQHRAPLTFWCNARLVERDRIWLNEPGCSRELFFVYNYVFYDPIPSKSNRSYVDRLVRCSLQAFSNLLDHLPLEPESCPVQFVAAEGHFLQGMLCKQIVISCITGLQGPTAGICLAGASTRLIFFQYLSVIKLRYKQSN